MNLKLPKTAIIVLIYRDGKYITANGDTKINAGDHLLMLAENKETVEKVMERFNMKTA